MEKLNPVRRKFPCKKIKSAQENENQNTYANAVRF